MAYHYSKKDRDKAVENLEMAVKLDPDNDDYREYLERAKAAKERGK
jgi:tetratricopeptide (TPR) repeat protein